MTFGRIAAIACCLLLVPVGGAAAPASSSGTGVLDVSNLSLAINSQLSIVFDITLRPAIANGTVVTNQGTTFTAGNITVAISDDPNVGGIADPFVVGDEDPTRVTIVSAPAWPAVGV